MEAELLVALKDIKLALYCLIIIVFLGAVANWARAWFAIKDDFFNTTASSLYQENNIDELLTLCDTKLAKNPNHSYALWYKAKALYQQHDYGKAKECFEKLALIEPSWQKSHIQPILDLIETHDNQSINSH